MIHTSSTSSLRDFSDYTGTLNPSHCFYHGGNQKVNHGRFVGATAEIKHHVYDIANDRTNFETFEKTTREIANYVGRTCQDGGDFRNGMLALELPPLDPPVYKAPTGDNVTEDDRMAAKTLWEIKLKKWDRRMYDVHPRDQPANGLCHHHWSMQ